MTDNRLKPLSPEEAAEFEGRRESASVVQHKCAGCGAWYDTAKRDRAWQETFNCDCGQRISFTVPAMDGVRPLSNEEVLDLFDPSARLDTGMSAAEAIKRASAWWDKTGRALMSAEASRRGGRPFASSDPDDDGFVPSLVFAGYPWDMLDRRAKIMVVKVWHHFNVRRPDLVGGDPDQPFRPQDRKSLN